MRNFGHVWSNVFFTLLVTHAVTSGQASVRVKRQSQMDPLLRNVCDGKKDGSYQHPYSCGLYVQCFQGSYTEGECPWNMYYNVKTRFCDYKRKIKCKEVDGMIETEAESAMFGPQIPVSINHPPITIPKNAL
ncbi:hypothetical protein BV898_15429 [Hypsibius exemplaris]|uniref:Chitin-binding type-2 domain-containing protein n=1 Tax=Hypsibius exemplaris TaxID=2072580 RepID=A0A9X6RK67_HYPEX|nr:hypothetical protein BV898_15429 [Hypsibius exemplaris]